MPNLTIDTRDVPSWMQQREEDCDEKVDEQYEQRASTHERQQCDELINDDDGTYGRWLARTQMWTTTACTEDGRPEIHGQDVGVFDTLERQSDASAE